MTANQASKADSFSKISRKNWIVKRLSETGRIHVDDIANEFHVSKMTAWRDLNRLADDKEYSKVYGGLIKNSKETNLELPFEEKRQQNLIKKRQIARFAAENFINENQIVIFEGSSTVFEMIPYLRVQDLTILTNGVKSMYYCVKKNPNYKVFSCGGIVREKSMTLIGEAARDFFSKFRADTLFLSGAGFTLKDGLMDPDIDDHSLKKIMCERAKQIIVLVDSSKLEKPSLISTIPLEKIDIVVTNKGISDEIKFELEQHQIKLYLV